MVTLRLDTIIDDCYVLTECVSLLSFVLTG